MREPRVVTLAYECRKFENEVFRFQAKVDFLRYKYAKIIKHNGTQIKDKSRLALCQNLL